ncbi:hypothetical protein A8950_2337 [Dongia mobilis]|uniref:Uncharacterized protein n=1 Tax=Dongia mobilis TaxID=578943 RepID=A0A4R6WTR4_9PROT|nr:hypothetical protein [Dongia mobilis]TDQ82514.1 hypothetical protein A8950_2337 [Dongia mobilis]
MTLATTQSRITYAGDGVTAAFAIPFVFFGADEIEVVERDLASGSETVRSLVTDFTLGGGGGESGTLTALVPPPPGTSWTIIRRTRRTQLVDYTPNDPFPAETHERALDRLTALVQELDDRLDRTPRLSPTASSADLTLPLPAAGRLIGWNHDASGLENRNLPEGAAVYAGIADVLDGSSDDAAVTPRGLAALWRQGAAIASAATLAEPASLARGGYHHVSGASTIGAFWAGAPAGTVVELCFAAALTLTHDPLLLILPGAADVAAAPGDVARFRAEASGLWRCVSAPPRWYVGGAGLALPVTDLASGHSLAAADLGRELRFTAGGVTLDLLPAAVAGNGAVIAIRNAAASGEVTLDPAGAELLDGLTQRLLRLGDQVLLRSDGAAWQTLAGDYSYDSGELSITSGGTLTLAHGLGAAPQDLRPVLRCKTAEAGWAVGDEIAIGFANTGTGFGTHRGLGLRADASNIVLRYGSGASAFGYAHGGTGSEANLTNANWRLILRARAR